MARNHWVENRLTWPLQYQNGIFRIKTERVIISSLIMFTSNYLYIIILDVSIVYRTAVIPPST